MGAEAEARRAGILASENRRDSTSPTIHTLSCEKASTFGDGPCTCNGVHSRTCMSKHGGRCNCTGANDRDRDAFGVPYNDEPVVSQSLTIDDLFPHINGCGSPGTDTWDHCVCGAHELRQAYSAAETVMDARTVLFKRHTAVCGVTIGMKCNCTGTVPVPSQEAPTRLDTLDLRALLLGDINRLRYTWRWNMTDIGSRENVAEHSFYVAMYSFWLAQWAFHYGAVIVKQELLLVRALFHDAEESRTGDFSRLFKHSNPELKEVIDRYAKPEFRKVVSAILPGDHPVLGHLTHQWEISKDSSTEGCILALADFLSVFSHMWQEVNRANATMADHYDTMLEYLAKFDGSEFDFLRPVVNDVQRLVRAVLADPELRRRLEVR